MDVFVQCSKVEASLRRGSTVECLAWCGENKTSLKKVNVRYRAISLLVFVTKTYRVLLNSSFAYSNLSSWFGEAITKKLHYTLGNFSHHRLRNTSWTSRKQLPCLPSPPPPLASHTWYAMGFDVTRLQLTNHTGNVLRSSLGVPCYNFHQHPSQPLWPPLPTPSSHRPLSGSLGP